MRTFIMTKWERSKALSRELYNPLESKSTKYRMERNQRRRVVSQWKLDYQECNEGLRGMDKTFSENMPRRIATLRSTAHFVQVYNRCSQIRLQGGSINPTSVPAVNISKKVQQIGKTVSCG